MRQKFFIVAVVGLCSFPLRAGVRFGLGDAVAKRSADLINQAGANSTLVGFNAASALPACSGNTLYTALPTDLSGVSGIVPLGNLNPTGHTFPTDHIYLYVQHTSTSDWSTPALDIPVYAPGDITITDVSTSEANNNPATADYGVTFYACRDVQTYYGHVKTLTSTFRALLAAAPQQVYCSDYTTGGNSFHRCDTYTNFTMKAGDQMGTAGHGTIGPVGLDLGSYDARITPLAFVSPQRHQQSLYTVCPLDYFSPSPKTMLYARLGAFDGSMLRTIAPLCGTIMYDVAGTAKGDWYKPGQPDNPEDPHLALANDNVRPNLQDFSIGSSLPNFFGMIISSPTASAAFVNQDFTQITLNGNIYCYDYFVDPNPNNPQPPPSRYILLQMPSTTTLKIEYVAGFTGCGAGPWAFSSNAVTFQR